MCRFMIYWAMYDIQMEGLKTNAQTCQEPSTRAARQLVNFILSFVNIISAQHVTSKLSALLQPRLLNLIAQA